MASPSRQMLALEGSAQVSGAQGILLISSPNSSSALLMAKGLDPLSEGQAYYVWLTSDSQSTIMGALTVDSQGWGMLSLGPSRSISLFQKVWVTVEPVSTIATAATPSGTPMLWGNIADQWPKWSSDTDPSVAPPSESIAVPFLDSAYLPS